MPKGFRAGYHGEEISALIPNADKTILATWALDCADRVLHLFESPFPQDPRPRAAIESGRSWVRGEVEMWDARKLALPAHAAARDAKADEAACAAARATGQALGTKKVCHFYFKYRGIHK
jgi:hypothetical protein